MFLKWNEIKTNNTNIEHKNIINCKKDILYI